MFQVSALVVTLLLLLGGSSALPSYQAPLLSESSPTAIPGEYIVVLKVQLSKKAVADQLAVARKLITEYGGIVTSVYSIGNFNGFAVKLSDKARDVLRTMKEVAYVEYNQKVYPEHAPSFCYYQAEAPWGLVRTNFRDLPIGSNYYYDSTAAGEGVDVYIIDTGIETTHTEFEGRAKWGADFVEYPPPKTDLHGHGTKVAGIVMSHAYGVAKKATAIDVRVFNATGGGATSDTIINAVNWVAGQHRPGKKSVANMSLGMGYAATVNDAVDAAVTAGVNVIVAAGNDGIDACKRSPSSASKVVTVMASDSTDKYASTNRFKSNHGTCAHIFAPGVDITTTWLNNKDHKDEGTSMATPHVAGVVAKYLSSQSTVPTPASVKTWLVNNATPNKIKNIPTSDTPNKLLFMQPCN